MIQLETPNLLRRYGWGVPSEERVLTSAHNAVTLVTQDEFVPFEGPEYAARAFRLHELPWPEEALRDLAAANVTLRVTLSYFIEPSPGRKGWGHKFRFQSHGLRFEVKSPLENTTAAVNQGATFNSGKCRTASPKIPPISLPRAFQTQKGCS